MSAPVEAVAGEFEKSRELFEALIGFLEGERAAGLEHSELEARLEDDGRELLRALLQDHLDLRAVREQRVEAVAGADGVRRGAVERGHERTLQSVFGEVSVGRLAYRARGAANLHPADAALNLPAERHSHGLRRLAAIESSRGSFDEGVQAIERATGQGLGKRQLEELAGRAAADFDAFYAERERAPDEDGDVLVLSCDGKGVVMRPDALRAQTAKAQAASTSKLQTRLSKGEKRGRKRIAEVGAVYEAAPAPRTKADVLPEDEQQRAGAIPGPVAKNKWLCASVVENAAEVVSQIFDEAERRDPLHERTWVALVDGNNHQIDRIKAEARSRGAPVTIVCDFVHVLEYLWKAAWSFHAEGDPAAEAWVRRHASKVLDGAATRVAGSIRRAATRAGLDPTKRAGADACATYLTNKRAYLDYPTALKQGWPIATGVIEGACRHLVKDRMDLTGARWGLGGAEAILKLRALRTNDDFDDYWHYHLAREQQRLHLSRYADNAIPQAA
ncbi:MAG: ISKra4 family transposase [Actinobacteria bacterium]|nr:ISKra4 family transposase [Actinomycetota bacterium]